MSNDGKKTHQKKPGTEFNRSTLMAAGPDLPSAIVAALRQQSVELADPIFSTAMIEALTRIENKRPLMELDEDDDTRT